MFDEAYIEYLVHFHCTRDYFECHEILEERWKQELPLDRESIWVAFIQLAVALYHHRRGNLEGAKRLMKKSINKFQKNDEKIEQFGLNKYEFWTLIDHVERRIMGEKPYVSVSLPIEHPDLLHKLKEKCSEFSCTYPSKSDLTNPELIHRHIYRS
ncbi:MAG: DUF309 domain-containing protein [Bacillaceae bacterium]|nr:DUF309 domain-containing protein [Bacillaceae bacterium]